MGTSHLTPISEKDFRKVGCGVKYSRDLFSEFLLSPFPTPLATDLSPFESECRH